MTVMLNGILFSTVLVSNGQTRLLWTYLNFSLFPYQIFRCWVFWERSYLIVSFPILLWLSSVASAIAMLVFQGNGLWAPNLPAVANKNATKMTTAFVGQSLVLDLYVTCKCLSLSSI
jgi:hypothetical protein